MGHVFQQALALRCAEATLMACSAIKSAQRIAIGLPDHANQAARAKMAIASDAPLATMAQSARVLAALAVQITHADSPMADVKKGATMASGAKSATLLAQSTTMKNSQHVTVRMAFQLHVMRHISQAATMMEKVNARSAPRSAPIPCVAMMGTAQQAAIQIGTDQLAPSSAPQDAILSKDATEKQANVRHASRDSQAAIAKRNVTVNAPHANSLVKPG